MSEKASSVEDKIIQATIECIETYGISGTTNRQIAQVAGVNNAAINYYFRSKDVLMLRCMEITLKNAFDLREMPPMAGAVPQERCIAILVDLMQGGYQYPGITRAHFFNLFTQGQYDALLMEWINRFVDDLASDLQSRGCMLEQNELKLGLVQILSAVILAILAPKLFERQHGVDLLDAGSREAYVTRLVTRLLA
jgi:AcrR family transcriptional regulator